MESGIAALRQHTAYEPAMDLAGFVVQASDGRLGEIDKGLADGGGRVEGGRREVGGHADGGGHRNGPARGVRRLFLPVGSIVSIDLTDRVVYLDRTREEIRRGRTAGGACYLLREV